MGEEQLFDVDTCRMCGCTDDHACEGGCYWVEEDLCSQCAEKLWAVWCYRSGEAFLAKYMDVPAEGLVILAHEDEALLREAFEVISTHGYEKGRFFVPGLAIAESDDEALEMARDYQKRLQRCVDNPPSVRLDHLLGKEGEQPSDGGRL